jgi:hypothetical protein
MPPRVSVNDERLSFATTSPGAGANGQPRTHEAGHWNSRKRTPLYFKANAFTVDVTLAGRNPMPARDQTHKGAIPGQSQVLAGRRMTSAPRGRPFPS